MFFPCHFQEGVDLLSPQFSAKITEEQLAHILRPDRGDPMPLLPQRVENLREMGRVLLEVSHFLVTGPEMA